MTIAISMKVNDGIVLAADSATTMIGRGATGEPAVINVYNNANKIFNLYKGLPIGAITWGAGSIGQASIATLAKDFRNALSDADSEFYIDAKNYTIEEVSQKFKKFIFDDNYVKAFEDWPEKPPLGFMIVGYSSGHPLAEEWILNLQTTCDGPQKIRGDQEVGITWNGEPEAITRLYFGFGTLLPNVLSHVGLEEAKVDEIMTLCQTNMQAQMVTPAMPIQDAIDLGIFLVDTTVGFSKFSPGATTVGGPTEVAAITKHEGFKWVKRKHYFDEQLNYERGTTNENRN